MDSIIDIIDVMIDFDAKPRKPIRLLKASEQNMFARKLFANIYEEISAIIGLDEEGWLVMCRAFSSRHGEAALMHPYPDETRHVIHVANHPEGWHAPSALDKRNGAIIKDMMRAACDYDIIILHKDC